MNLSTFIIERALKQLNLSDDVIKQFGIANALSDVAGRGFPRELFELSMPVIVRGLLNFATMQMNRDWIYPMWVHKQLDPKSRSYIPRAQNPLFINITHRNWTLLGTIHGSHEAIVDPRGLMTPLPREWSVDTWLVTDHAILFPSLAEHAVQEFDTDAPRLRTIINEEELTMSVEHFAGSTSKQLDIIFSRAVVRNNAKSPRSLHLCVAIRPFNPEGVAPVSSVEFKTPKIAHVNKSVGVVFARNPDWLGCSSYETGDIARKLQDEHEALFANPGKLHAVCERGLAHAVAAFQMDLAAGEEKSVQFSVALGSDTELRRRPIKQSWRVSYEKRSHDQAQRWAKEIAAGGQFQFADERLQKIFDACRITLLALHDGPFISPGPALYHHFWYRDAAVMLRALDLLGYHKRVRQVIDAFPDRLTVEGFFRGPDGEWDSNGAVLWTILRHWKLTRPALWLKDWAPNIDRAAKWILAMRKKHPMD